MTNTSETPNPAHGSMYALFETSPELEMNGIELDYGWGVVTIARAGGANKAFSRTLEAKTKIHRRAIATETMDPEVALKVLRETYSEAVILRWETRVGEDRALKSGIEPKGGGKLMPFNPANVVAALTNLPDLFLDIQEQAARVALFRETVMEDDAGN